MADPFVYSDRTGTAITGTTSQSLLGASLSIPTASLAVDTEFQALGAATYLNNTGSSHNIDLDLYANGNLIHRSRMYTIAANSLTRSVRAEYSLVVTESNTCMVTSKASTSAAGNTGEDIRNVSTVEVAETFDISAAVTLDWKATLSGTSDLATHSLTPYFFRMNTLGTFTVIVGSGPSDPIDLPYINQLGYVCLWLGSAYQTRPALPFQVMTYVGPVEPNGVNSPGGPSSLDVWVDSSGA